MEPVRIFDTTLRDGEQSPGVTLVPQEKLAIARAMEELGVDVLEAGFPIASPGDAEAVRLIAQSVREPIIAALCRTRLIDIEAALRALEPAAKPRIHIVIATSELHMRTKLRMTREQVLEEIERSVTTARKYVDDVEFSAEDATRSDPAFLEEVFKLAEACGATTVNIPDTVGYTVPEAMGQLVRRIKSVLKPETIVSVHCHDDLGLAVANTLAGVQAGAGQVEVAMNGIGERAGNCSLEEVVMALITRQDYFQRSVGIRPQHLYRISQMVSRFTGMVVPPNKAIIGDNAFAHESGIHQDGILKDRRTYEILDPDQVGAPKSRLVLGKHSGRHAFVERLKALHIHAGPEMQERLFQRFKELADQKRYVSDADIEALYHNEVGVATQQPKLEAFQVQVGTRVIPTALVEVADAGEVGRRAIEVATGDGPVDALFQAVCRAFETEAELVEYRLTPVGGGPDAQGEVFVQVRRGEDTAYGRGLSTDILAATAQAFTQAMARLVRARQEVAAS
ncbi:MAG: 2-isopropylmalate synthase [Actinomycetia bacterium]|nr:2-isopropylmalate synthase [Actinomycetes bacterium]